MSSIRSSAPAGAQAAAPETPEKKKKSKVKLLIVLVLVLAAAGAAWFFLLKPDGNKVPKKPEPGVVVPVDPININLDGGHYLKFAFSLQLKKGVKEGPDPSHALAIAIDQFSGQSMTVLAQPAARRKAIATFTEAVEKAYGEDVIDLYPTTLVMQ
ncbi:flagellar basal body-associated FliL family protein [Angustibacter sp. McL0619]|uniref:flagellar basal body-associated FliL family protein n=1 Tax=Angustibacter sp. McL0619 TaxID=3415676 RepID=UPI003CF9C23B